MEDAFRILKRGKCDGREHFFSTQLSVAHRLVFSPPPPRPYKEAAVAVSRFNLIWGGFLRCLLLRTIPRENREYRGRIEEEHSAPTPILTLTYAATMGMGGGRGVAPS